MKYLKAVFSKTAPTVNDVLWIKPVDGGVTLYVKNGGWVSLKTVDDKGTAGVADDKPKAILNVSNIQALTTKQCNALNVGDQVIKKTGNQKHLYTVTYKEEKQGMCLTYMDAENVETIAYDWNGTSREWEFTDKTVTPIASNG